MMFKSAAKLLLYVFILSSCQTGKLDVLVDLPFGLKEVSALEYSKDERLLWIIEDSGNSNTLYALDAKAKFTKKLIVNGAENEDWEDLAIDENGTLYIGDFGNNSKDRKKFQIYKVLNPAKAEKSVTAEPIEFTLPKKMKSEDFEAFFLHKNTFYIFSKDDKKGVMISVENKIGKQVARKVDDFNLDGKNDKITSADISEDGKTIVLLNHEKLWKLTNFKDNNFFNGDVEKLEFEHDSQKEGIVFITENEVFITDEKDDSEGGNLYRFKL
ncbi:MAG: hypothetical protein AAF688_07430 [Bacteroidota bacterium]